MKPLLTMDNLEVRFASAGKTERIVVGEFNLEIFPAETLALVGESGCGKTTIARAALRLIHTPGKITRGKIFFGEEDVLALPERRLREIRWKEIALIFQEPASALNPLYRAGGQVAEVLRLHLRLDAKAAKAKTLQLFEAVDLPDGERCFNAYPHELSSGMRQRVMIAMAMACEPRLIIADEPTSALDARHQREVLECLQGLKRKHGLSLLFITHDLNLVAAWASRIAIMHAGKIVEAGATAEILARPQHPQTRQLLEAAERFNRTVP